MRWSLTLMSMGILIIAVGALPPYFGGITFNTLEVTASFVAIGILVFLVGLLIRKAKRALDASFRRSTPNS